MIDAKSGIKASRPQEAAALVIEKKPGFFAQLFGKAKSAGEMAETLPTMPYLPSELVGGSIPVVAGFEDEAVWNAASQACGTERVHYCYTTAENRCWYLASPSSSMASNPDSWCPLAAALPGNSEHWDKQTVYLYEQDGAASALRWDQDTGKMQLFLGASRTILPKIQSMEANFVTISADSATPVRWKNRALNQEKLSRFVIKMLLLSGLAVTAGALLFWIGGYATTAIIQPKLAAARESTRTATNQLLIQATDALQSNLYRHMVRVQELLDTLMVFGGTLVRYEVMPDGSIQWEALVPRALEGDISKLQATASGMEADGRLRIKGTQ